MVQPELAQVHLSGPARVLEELGPADISVVLHIGQQDSGVVQVKPELLVPEAVLSARVDPPSFQVIIGSGEKRR